MRHLAPVLASFVLLFPILSSAQDPDPAGRWAADLPVETEETATQPLISGSRLFLQVQINGRVGELAAGEGLAGLGGGFDSARLGGVPDAIVGARFGRLTIATGITWSHVGDATTQRDPCGIAREEVSLERSNTLFGVIPSVRYDMLVSPDGRGRMEAGINLPLMVASRSQEEFEMCMPPFDRPAEITEESASDGIYGAGLLLGGRYHIWPALAVGVELGFTYLVFDYDSDPDTDMDRPSVTAFGFHTALALSVELPI